MILGSHLPLIIFKKGVGGSWMRIVAAILIRYDYINGLITQESIMQTAPLSVILLPLLTMTMRGITYQHASYLSICANFKQKLAVLVITLLTIFPGLEIASYLGNMGVLSNLITASIIFGTTSVIFDVMRENMSIEKRYRHQVLHKALHYEMLKAQVEAK